MASNKSQGRVEQKLGDGAGAEVVDFRLGINELIELQDELGIENDEEFLKSLDNLRSLKKVRSLVKAAMKGSRPDVTDQQAGDVITELGVARVREQIAKALEWAMPEAERGAAPGRAGKAPAASPGVRPS